ncbi:MAG: SPOR domain-containing protein [Rhodothermales bacterium]|nr:SPOR domain-containing protein [Rhodothermales bacterium]
MWFAIPIVVALIAAAVWFFQRPDSASETTAGDSITSVQPFEAQPADPTGTEPESGGVDEGPVTSQAEGANDAEQTPAEATPDDDAPAPSDPEPAYALDRSVDGYTLIVGSSPDRAAADEQMSNYTELDLPFGVLDYSEEESSMYRLAIGLYDSAQQADSARQAMAGALPSGTWVWRIR